MHQEGQEPLEVRDRVLLRNDPQFCQLFQGPYRLEDNLLVHIVEEGRAGQQDVFIDRLGSDSETHVGDSSHDFLLMGLGRRDYSQLSDLLVEAGDDEGQEPFNCHLPSEEDDPLAEVLEEHALQGGVVLA